MQYVGHLNRHDPLFGYLACDIMPQLGADGRDGFRVFSSNSSHAVYIYEDRCSGKRVVGKYFFTPGKDDRMHAAEKMRREFNNISVLRGYTGKNHYVARALGCNEYLNCLLVTEYCYGEALDVFIMRAIREHDADGLYRKLAALGNFLATIHNRSARPVMVDFQKVCRYFDAITGHLAGIISPEEGRYLRDLCDRFRHDKKMYLDQEVTVHGDATPANFFFGDGDYVITFDLERMQWSDRVFDVGRIAGELQHFFLRHTGNKYAAEPFIGHFLWKYAGAFPDRQAAFASITGRVPFYLGMTLLRIARNDYLLPEYRRKLVDEAKLALQRTE
ncbi:MAG: aminoglycoside phosphotransferase family protein [Lentisphaerae bacterium]|nr:aminoglycoside phosphotransferase family protein [Lentisphaerota bacterium]